MYDWPEMRAEVDAQWARLRESLRRHGVDAPERLARCNADLPPVPGGIRDVSGAVIAPDPATLPPDGLDHHALWLHPALLLAQTCWGPMSLGMESHVQVVGQPDYSGFEGGLASLYSSAIIMHRPVGSMPVATPLDGSPSLPVDLLRGKRFVYNSADSMSGILALTRDLQARGEAIDIFPERMESGGHRASIVTVAEGKADVAAIDCRSWAIAQRFEPAAANVQVVGWTASRKGLPYICARTVAPETVSIVREALASAGMLAAG